MWRFKYLWKTLTIQIILKEHVIILVNNFQNMKIKHMKDSLVIFIVHLFQRTLVCQIDRWLKF